MRRASASAAAGPSGAASPAAPVVPAAGRERSRSGSSGARTAATTRPLAAAEVAWLAALPVAVIVVVAIVALGEPLGALLFPQEQLTFYASVVRFLRPEPTEQARFLIALTGPVLLALATVLIMRRPPLMRPRLTLTLVGIAQASLLAFVVGCFVAQWRTRFGVQYTGSLAETSPRTVYFTAATLVVAALLAAALAVSLRHADAAARWSALTAESRARRIVASLVAAVLTAIWLLTAVNFDDTIFLAHQTLSYHIEFPIDEAFAVVNGHSPLGDFAAQYGSLWPYVTAVGLGIFGTTLGTFTILMSTYTLAAMVAIFDLLRRVTRRSLVALVLFVPFMATSFFIMRGPPDNRYALSNLYGAFPLRYAGPLLLAWVTARHLGGVRPRRAWPVFLVAGLVLLNNGDFGIPACGASVAAILWAQGRPSWASLGRLAVQAAIGLGIALAVVSVLVFTRTGDAPDFSLLFTFARMFAVAGFGMMPMITVGFHLVIYVTFVGAIGVATVRAIDRAPDRLLTGMLVWSGVFGLGAGSYFVGRSHPEVLTNLFPAWALSVVLLVVVAARALAGVRSWTRATLPSLLVLAAFGILVCSVAQIPPPWSQIDRLQTKTMPVFDPRKGTEFVDRHTQPGEPVVILMGSGHRTAAALGIDNVSPYATDKSMPTVEQLLETVQRLREAGGRKVFVDTGVEQQWPELLNRISLSGFMIKARDRESDTVMWVDTAAR